MLTLFPGDNSAFNPEQYPAQTEGRSHPLQGPVVPLPPEVEEKIQRAIASLTPDEERGYARMLAKTYYHHPEWQMPTVLHELMLKHTNPAALQREVALANLTYQERSPAQQRVDGFLSDFLRGVVEPDQIPSFPTRGEMFFFEPDGDGRGSELAGYAALPLTNEPYIAPHIKSTRISQGASKSRRGEAHLPTATKRTTAYTFGVVEGSGLVPADKAMLDRNGQEILSVSKADFVHLLRAALNPPRPDASNPDQFDWMMMPFYAPLGTHARQTGGWVVAKVDPIVTPAVPGASIFPDGSMPLNELRHEALFILPGALTANARFVTQVFGSGENPFLSQHDLALDPERWAGSTEIVLLAPWLKSDPIFQHYFSKNPGKIVAYSMSHPGAPGGVFVTIIGDNYFGLCKKNLKEKIGAVALGVGTEEEHAGSALVFPAYALGDHYHAAEHPTGHTVVEVLRNRPDAFVPGPHPGMYVSAKYPPRDYLGLDRHGDAAWVHEGGIILFPENTEFRIVSGAKTPFEARYVNDGKERVVSLHREDVHVLPSGFSVTIDRVDVGNDTSVTQFVGMYGSALLMHKPCTVSGGGKSEISKASPAKWMPVQVGDLEAAKAEVRAFCAPGLFTKRFPGGVLREDGTPDTRDILSEERSAGSLIKLLNMSAERLSPEFAAYLADLSLDARALVTRVKVIMQRESGSSLEGILQRFTVSQINTQPSHQLLFDGRAVLMQVLRIGKDGPGKDRVFEVRPDVTLSRKFAQGDDIDATQTVPLQWLKKEGEGSQTQNRELSISVKVTRNCEMRLFQRPDDGIVRGADREIEWYMGSGPKTDPTLFAANYQWLGREDAFAERERIADFTPPMQSVWNNALTWPEGSGLHFVSPSHPVREVATGEPTKNPRVLQLRQDLSNPKAAYLAQLVAELHHRTPAGERYTPTVFATVPGQRVNPSDPKKGIEPTAVYGPIHFFDELEFIQWAAASLTGPSPSSTGAGSEGALTKGPFSLLPIHDLNMKVVIDLLTGAPNQRAITTTGSCGGVHVGHDLSALVPDVLARMSPAELDLDFLIRTGCVEQVAPFEFGGRTIHADALGWRVTEEFCRRFVSRVLRESMGAFSPSMLRPEKHDRGEFVAGIDNILASRRRVAEGYFRDGSIELACPPVRAALHCMYYGHYSNLPRAEVLKLFDRRAMLESAWYREWLTSRQRAEVVRLTMFAKNLDKALEPLQRGNPRNPELVELRRRRELVGHQLQLVVGADYIDRLRGSPGRDPKLPLAPL